jgi:TPR repeat protein
MNRSIVELNVILAANPDDKLALNRLAVKNAQESTSNSGIPSLSNSLEKIRFLEAAVSRGCPVAQTHLADHHWNHNRKEALANIHALYLKAAISGLDIAQFTLGVNIQLGYNPSQLMEYDDGFPWIIQAAAAGMPVAQARVSFLFRHGRACGTYSETRAIHPMIGEAGHGVDSVKAFTYASLSAAQGCVEGLCELGQCWENGVGCLPNEEKANAALGEAVGMGLTTAMHDLGMICMKRGDRGDTDQYEHAIHWFKMADEKGMVISLMVR